MDITHPDSFRVCNIPFCTGYELAGCSSDAGVWVGMFLCNLNHRLSISAWGLGAPDMSWWVVVRTAVLGMAFSYAVCIMGFLTPTGISAQHHIYPDGRSLGR